MAQKTNDLFDFMISTTNEMEQEYRRIQKRVQSDPGTAGDQGEENWKKLFCDWLPPVYRIVTKGRILTHDGTCGPQVDLLVLHPSYPSKLCDKKVYLAGGVLAAFECKITLRSSHIRKAVENSLKIRRNLPVRRGTPYREMHSSIIYGLLAHSHSLSRSRPEEKLESELYSADKELVQHPREMLDLLCVADLGTWKASKHVTCSLRCSHW
jgi:hypothetical protein